MILSHEVRRRRTRSFRFAARLLAFLALALASTSALGHGVAMHEVSFQGADGVLSGTLTIPASEGIACPPS